jgi:cysteinyl-tRNA synthetase
LRLKAAKPGEPSWIVPRVKVGGGNECSAMNLKSLENDRYHGGGND